MGRQTGMGRMHGERKDGAGNREGTLKGVGEVECTEIGSQLRVGQRKESSFEHGTEHWKTPTVNMNDYATVSTILI